MRGPGVLALIFCAAGCATGSAGAGGGPAAARQTLAAYADAIRTGDYDRAYTLMSAAYRRQTDREAFQRLLREHAAEVSQAADALAKGGEVALVAQVDAGGGAGRLDLAYEAGGWRLAADPLDLYGQRTPREALRSFVRALERKRYDVLVRFVPKRWRDLTSAEQLQKAWEGPEHDEVQRLAQNLKAHLLDPIHQEGDEARMPYGAGLSVKFVREEGLWRIQDPD
jgi:hypothetical protein